MNSSDPSKPDFKPQSLRVRPKMVTTYLILSLLVTALQAFIYSIVASPAGGLKLEPIEVTAFYLMAFLNLGGLAVTIALFFWRKWAAFAFYILLGLSLLWFGYLFLIQEGLNTFTISGFVALAVVPILLFRWVINKVWLQLI